MGALVITWRTEALSAFNRVSAAAETFTLSVSVPTVSLTSMGALTKGDDDIRQVCLLEARAGHFQRETAWLQLTEQVITERVSLLFRIDVVFDLYQISFAPETTLPLGSVTLTARSPVMD
jgi:hypothetical protein